MFAKKNFYCPKTHTHIKAYSELWDICEWMWIVFGRIDAKWMNEKNKREKKRKDKICYRLQSIIRLLKVFFGKVIAVLADVPLRGCF